MKIASKFLGCFFCVVVFFAALTASAQVKMRSQPEGADSTSPNRYTMAPTNGIVDTERFTRDNNQPELNALQRNTIDMDLFNRNTNNILGLKEPLVAARKAPARGSFRPDSNKPDVIRPEFDRVQKVRPDKVYPRIMYAEIEVPRVLYSRFEKPVIEQPTMVRPSFSRGGSSRGSGRAISLDCQYCKKSQPPRNCCAHCGRIYECQNCILRKHRMPNGEFYRGAVDPLERTVFNLDDL